MKKEILLLVFEIIFISGCNELIEPIDDNNVEGCVEDAKICSDGSIVSRVLPSCEFEECPEIIETNSYNTEVECLEATGCSECKFVSCDYIPLGKTFEEVCGENFVEGWQCRL